MRPIATPESALINPLNGILATEANVRLLRVLCRTDVPPTVTELARQTGLTPHGARRALLRLEATGIVTFVGASRSRRVAMRQEHPLAPAVAALFASEKTRVDDLFAALREGVAKLEPSVQSAWLQGPLAAGRDAFDDPIVLVILTPARVADSVPDAVARDLARIEATYDVMIELHTTTSADMHGLSPEQRDELAAALPLYGPAPATLLEAPASKGRVRRPLTHQQLDERARNFGAAIARAITEDPALIERARAQIEGRMKTASPHEQRQLREWSRILSQSPARIRRFLVDPGERATRLRQSLPFLQALSPAQRKEILAAPTEESVG